MTIQKQTFIVVDPTGDVESYSHHEKRSRTPFELLLKLFGGILDYIVSVFMFLSLAFILQDYDISDCRITRPYLHIMTAVPFLSLLASIWMGHYDSQPKMVVEKSFFMKLFFWPTPTEDDKGWTAYRRFLPSLLTSIALTGLTAVASLDLDTSALCSNATNGYLATLARWRLISVILYAVTNSLHVFLMFFI